MFKKLKDKLAEEVKSSPQRIQQFAQAAQAAVTSASSSISDITNNDLFSIGENDMQKGDTVKLQQASAQKNAFQDVSLAAHNPSFSETADFRAIGEIATDSQRQRRLSNSSFASDVSFKLPSYESPSMYHLQSDMEVSASEAEERGLTSPGGSGGSGLDRVTKDQLYAAYTRTQQRYAKYRTQYADLARHYKLLERENAKAKSVLVETQDKALRRISELREQCSLEQSAKAHLERALRMEIEERNMKIDTLTTKVQLLQTGIKDDDDDELLTKQVQENVASENSAQLIDLSGDGNENQICPETNATEKLTLNNKIEKMEHLMNKYKESLKTMKEKNSQLTTEIQVLSNDYDAKTKENERLQATTAHLIEARKIIQDMKDQNEELQNQINTYDFSKTKETSTLEFNLEKSQNEIVELKKKIDVFTKREEDYAISLAENKLSIHKELESKETEIKSLKNNLSASTQEIQALSMVINDYKNKIECLKQEHSKITSQINELNVMKNKSLEKDVEIKELTNKCSTLEHLKTKWDEEFKCLELQIKQETAEKLAMIDRNAYLENKNKLISEENTKKSTHISILESELQEVKQRQGIKEEEIIEENNKTISEVNTWKEKCKNLESEIQEERIELIKLQSEIEKLLSNYDSVESENAALNSLLFKLKSEKSDLEKDFINKSNTIKIKSKELINEFGKLRACIFDLGKEIKLYRSSTIDFSKCETEINELLKNYVHKTEVDYITINYENLKTNYSHLEDSNKILKDKYVQAIKEIELLKNETQSFQNKLTEAENEKKVSASSYSELRNTNEEHAIRLKEMDSLEAARLNLTFKLEEYKNELSVLQNIIKQNNDRYELQLKDKETEKEALTAKIHEQEIIQETCINRFDSMKINLQSNIEDLHRKNELLQNENKEILLENTSLKNNIESIVKNFKILENELADIRKSHSEIVDEKDRLSSAIEVFEQNESMKKNRSNCNIETQTVEKCSNLQEELNITMEENNILKSKCEQIKQEKEEIYEKLREVEQENNRNSEDRQKYLDDCLLLRTELLEWQGKYQTLQTELCSLSDINKDLNFKITNRELDKQGDADNKDYVLLKEENRRLLSDIEGLQTYLSKISKENSTLNDKLREIIASSGNAKFNDTIEDITKLKNEIQNEKEKSDELMRQNTLLAEENLELKDQIQIQNYVHPVENIKKNGSEQDDKYTELLHLKNTLENKLTDAQLVNKSVNSNVKQLQENNQKLRLANEKLERRLDEALVSLRHLHSLQENTELEYLRNVLYEYLTGSGAHSETLAKVLAAVVKFDDKQTLFILQKEKERQGLLRQLGLL